MKLYEAFALSLQKHGINQMFGLIGDANLFMVDSFCSNAECRYVAAANEAGAVLMANGFADVTHELGVVTVTQGPGLTNTVTALVESVRNHVPILLIAGDTAVQDKGNLQNISQREVVESTGAGFEQARSPLTTLEDLDVAIRRAFVERRPIVLNVNANFWWEEVEFDVHSRVRRYAPQAVAPDLEALDAAVGIVASASRPIVLAGVGAASDRSRTALVRLADRIGAPLMTSVRGMGLFRDEVTNLGVFGSLSGPSASESIAASDCVISFGAGLNPMTTDKGSLLEGKRLIQIDINPQALSRYVRADVEIVGDAGEVADKIVEWLDVASIEVSKYWPEPMTVPSSREVVTDLERSEPLTLLKALDRINASFPSDRTFVCDAGRFMDETLRRIDVSEPRAYVHTAGFASIGLGMGNAIGAAVGREGHPVLLTCGDGGFMLGGLAEFNSAVREKLDIVVFIFNDSSYGAEHIQFRNRDMDPSIAIFNWPDLAPVADSLGGQGFTVRNIDDLDIALDAVMRRDRPILIDIKLDPDLVPSINR